MKKLTVGLAVLLSGYAATSFAVIPTGTSRCDVCVPTYCGGFSFGLTGLYWRPTTDHLDFALEFPSTLGGVGAGPEDVDFNNGRFRKNRHDYDWGFKANIGYVFPCSGNDVNLVYTHWENNRRHHRNDIAGAVFPSFSSLFDTVDGTFDVVFPATTFAFTLGGLGTGSTLTVPLTPTFTLGAADVVALRAHSRFEDNAWDLEFGQAINAGCNFRLRWYGGLRYTRLKNTINLFTELARGPERTPGKTVTGFPTPVLAGEVGPLAVAPVFDVTARVLDIARQKSDFDGVGPRFGMDASYHLGGGFGVVGGLSTALLVGDTESRFRERIETTATATLALTGAAPLTTITETIVGLLPVTIPITGVTPAGAVIAVDTVETRSFRHPDETRVVPNIDAKLGIDWSYQFCNCSRSVITVEAGYMVSHYFNAIDRLSGIEVEIPALRSRQALDVSFDGPYVGVQVRL